MTLLSIIAPLLGMLYAIVLLWNRLVDSADLALLAGMYVATAFGITIGYHRMLTHRSFAAHPAIRSVPLALGSLAVQLPYLRPAQLQHPRSEPQQLAGRPARDGRGVAQ